MQDYSRKQPLKHTYYPIDDKREYIQQTLNELQQ